VVRILLIVCVLGFFGCDSPRNEQYKELSALRERIMEDNIAGLNGPAQRVLWLRFSGKAMAFYRAYPSDSSSPSLVYNAAELFFKSNEGDSALQALKILEGMSSFSRQAELLFLRGQVLQMLFLDYQQAEIAYQSLLDKYPTHPKVPSAQTALAVLRNLTEPLPDSVGLLNESATIQR